MVRVRQVPRREGRGGGFDVYVRRERAERIQVGLVTDQPAVRCVRGRHRAGPDAVRAERG